MKRGAMLLGMVGLIGTPVAATGAPFVLPQSQGKSLVVRHAQTDRQRRNVANKRKRKRGW